jgi:hypothetical protein
MTHRRIPVPGLKRLLYRLAVVFISTAVTAGLVGCATALPGDPSFSFDATADARMFTPPEYPGREYFLGVCHAIRTLGPGVFMISPGDMEPPARVRATLDQVMGPDYAWYDAPGNHEGDAPEHMTWLRQYNAGGNTLPRIVRCGPPGASETCYSFDHENTHFVAINQYFDGQTDMNHPNGTVSDPLYEWLVEDLESTDKKHIFVFGHEPAFPISDMDNGRLRHVGKSLDRDPERRHRFWTLLRKHNVTAFICGHTHNASVAKINGVWQIDVGHSRGRGDDGARSTFAKFRVEGPHVWVDVYRGDEANEVYTLRHTEQLR